jgi:hypothetical protein
VKERLHPTTLSEIPLCTLFHLKNTTGFSFKQSWPPGRRKITAELLFQEYYSTLAKVRAALSNAWGITIIIDGWTDIQGKSIYNTIYATADGMHLPGEFAEVSSEKHDRHFIKGIHNGPPQ